MTKETYLKELLYGKTTRIEYLKRMLYENYKEEYNFELFQKATEYGLKTYQQKSLFAILFMQAVTWDINDDTKQIEKYIYVNKALISQAFGIGYSTIQRTLNLLIKNGALEIYDKENKNNHKYKFSKELWAYKEEFYRLHRLDIECSGYEIISNYKEI